MSLELKARSPFGCKNPATMSSERGFTLVEIMIVITIIAILTAAAVPNFIRYRKVSQMNACIANLAKIHAAYEQAKMAGLSPRNVDELCGPQAFLKTVPWCPSSDSNSYSLPATDHDVPTCSNSTEEYPHVLLAQQGE